MEHKVKVERYFKYEFCVKVEYVQINVYRGQKNFLNSKAVQRFKAHTCEELDSWLAQIDSPFTYELLLGAYVLETNKVADEVRGYLGSVESTTITIDQALNTLKRRKVVRDWFLKVSVPRHLKYLSSFFPE